MGMPNIVANFAVPFPSRAQGSGLISVVKTNGVYTITQDYTKVSQVLPPASQYPFTLVAIYNTNSKIYQTMSLQDFIAVAKNIAPATNVTHAMSPYAVLSSDVILLVDTSAGAVTVNLQPGATRTGNLIIKDVTGNAAANNITITPFGAERIDNLTPVPIDSNYGAINILPYGNGYTVIT